MYYLFLNFLQIVFKKHPNIHFLGDCSLGEKVIFYIIALLHFTLSVFHTLLLTDGTYEPPIRVKDIEQVCGI